MKIKKELIGMVVVFVMAIMMMAGCIPHIDDEDCGACIVDCGDTIDEGTTELMESGIIYDSCFYNDNPDGVSCIRRFDSDGFESKSYTETSGSFDFYFKAGQHPMHLLRRVTFESDATFGTVDYEGGMSPCNSGFTLVYTLTVNGMEYVGTQIGYSRYCDYGRGPISMFVELPAVDLSSLQGKDISGTYEFRVVGWNYPHQLHGLTMPTMTMWFQANGGSIEDNELANRLVVDAPITEMPDGRLEFNYSLPQTDFGNLVSSQMVVSVDYANNGNTSTSCRTRVAPLDLNLSLAEDDGGSSQFTNSFTVGHRYVCWDDLSSFSVNSGANDFTSFIKSTHVTNGRYYFELDYTLEESGDYWLQDFTTASWRLWFSPN